MSFLAAFFQYFGGNQANGKGDAEWDQDQVVEVAKDGDKVWDQVNWAEGVGDNQPGKGFGEPGSARVSDGKVEGVGFFFLLIDSLFPPVKKGFVLFFSSIFSFVCVPGLCCSFFSFVTGIFSDVFLLSRMFVVVKTYYLLNVWIPA